MTVAIILAVLSQGIDEPTLPPGTSVEFARTVVAVEKCLVAGDIAGARAAARGLPVRKPRLAWASEELLPANLRSELANSFTRDVGSWARLARGFSPTLSTESPDIVIGFSKQLPDGPDGEPLTTTIEYGTPLRAQIGLARRKPVAPTTRAEFTVDIAYALGRYLGIPDSPFADSAMYRGAGFATLMPGVKESELAGKNLDLSDKLREGIEAGKPIGLTIPSIELPAPRLELGESPQGKLIRTSIEVKNNGEGTLNFWIKPDCGCFRIYRPVPVLPHQSFKIPIDVDTSAYIGKHDKTLLLFSNDPLRPTIPIPVTFRSVPSYRLYRPGGEVMVVPSAGGTFDVFLFPNPVATFKPTSVQLDGLPGKVTFAAWSGDLADAEMQEGASPRKGWRFRIQMPAHLPPGRLEGDLLIETDSKRFGKLNYHLFAQNGIVPLPETTFFGDMGPGSTASLLVSRPNAPFKITRIDAGPFKATWRDQKKGWEYLIQLTYPGGQAKGELLIPIKIHTDDPKQPVVEALVNGNVK